MRTDIMDRFEPEDKLYLFGFSRGAFAVRALAVILFPMRIERQQFPAAILKN
jgi:uncharacterized protein (DUF2235 family)